MNNSINELDRLNKIRGGSTGYLTNKPLRINYEKLRYITVVGPYDNFQFDPFIKQAIQKFEKRIIKEALKIESEHYESVKAKAKEEALQMIF